MTTVTTVPTKAKTQTRRARVEERERAIVKAAGHLLAEVGVDKTTMSGIARRAGVAEGTVYLYFENKTALLRAVQATFYERLTEQASQGIVGIADTRARLEFLARLHLQTLMDDWPTVMVVLSTYRDIADYVERNEQYQFNRTYVAVFDAVIRDGINRGELRQDVPLRLLRDIFYGTLEYALRTSLLHDRDKEVAATVDRLMTVLLHGLAVPAATAATTAPEQASVAKATARLETIADRLEAVLAKGGRLESGRP